MHRFPKASRSELDEVRAMVAKGGGNKASQVFANNGSSQSVPSGAPTIITGWTEVYDSADAFDPTTGLFTVPVTGVYMVSAGLIYNTGGAPALTGYYIFISLDGAPVMGGNNIIPAGGGGTPNFGVQVAGVVHATKGQTLSVVSFHNAGIGQALNPSSALNTFSIAQVA